MEDKGRLNNGVRALTISNLEQHWSGGKGGGGPGGGD